LEDLALASLASPSVTSLSEDSAFFSFLPKLPKKEVRRLSLGVVASAAVSLASSGALATSASAAAVTVSGSMGLTAASSTGFSS
jgi:hypothetical protein